MPVTVKVYQQIPVIENEIFSFQLSEEVSFEELAAEVKNVFPLLKDIGFCMFGTDEHKELVCLSSSEELQHALSCSPEVPFRVFVRPLLPPRATPPSLLLRLNAAKDKPHAWVKQWLELMRSSLKANSAKRKDLSPAAVEAERHVSNEEQPKRVEELMTSPTVEAERDVSNEEQPKRVEELMTSPTAEAARDVPNKEQPNRMEELMTAPRNTAPEVRPSSPAHSTPWRPVPLIRRRAKMDLFDKISDNSYSQKIFYSTFAHC